MLISSVPPQDPRGEGPEKKDHGERFNPSERFNSSILCYHFLIHLSPARILFLLRVLEASAKFKGLAICTVARPYFSFFEYLITKHVIKQE